MTIMPANPVESVATKAGPHRCHGRPHDTEGTTSMPPNPSGLCQCGCGRAAPLARRTRRDLGHVRGQPLSFVLGHNARRGAADYELVDTGHDTPCHLWLRHTNDDGYAMVRRDGTLQLAHRWFYVQERGPIPEGLTLDHLCRVTRCVNADHMEPVPLRENIWRGWEARYGDAGHHPVRAERLARRLSQRDFGRLLGVAQTTVSAWERGLCPPPTDWSSKLRIDEREVIGGEVYGRRAAT